MSHLLSAPRSSGPRTVRRVGKHAVALAIHVISEVPAREQYEKDETIMQEKKGTLGCQLEGLQVVPRHRKRMHPSPRPPVLALTGPGCSGHVQLLAHSGNNNSSTNLSDSAYVISSLLFFELLILIYSLDGHFCRFGSRLDHHTLYLRNSHQFPHVLRVENYPSQNNHHHHARSYELRDHPSRANHEQVLQRHQYCPQHCIGYIANVPDDTYRRYWTLYVDCDHCPAVLGHGPCHHCCVLRFCVVLQGQRTRVEAVGCHPAVFSIRPFLRIPYRFGHHPSVW